MKKLIIVLIVTTLCMTMACQPATEVVTNTATPAPTPVATVIPTPTPEVIAPTPYPITMGRFYNQVNHFSGCSLRHIISMEQAIVSADFILEVRLEGVYAVPSTYSDGLRMRFNTVTCIKGKYDEDTIDIRIGAYAPLHFAIGESYIIMVRGFDSVYDPAIEYAMNIDNVMNIHNGKLYNMAKADEQECLFESKESFIDAIQVSLANPDIKPFRPSLYKVTHTLSLYPHEIIDYSDAIVEVTLTEVDGHGRTNPIVHCEVTHSYKGDLSMGDELQLYLYPSAIQGDSYLLLLHNDNGYYKPASRYGCVNLKETERYQQYMEYLTRE